MELLIFYVSITIALLNGIINIFFYKKLTDLKKGQENHYQFLLKVKNDIPILHTRVSELEEQILPPQDNKNEMH